MSFSFCLNKNELLLLSAFGLLFQGLDLDRKGKLMQDSQRYVCSAIGILERNSALGSTEFKRVACAMISVDRSSGPIHALKGNVSRKKSHGNMGAPQSSTKLDRKDLHAIVSRPPYRNKGTIKQEENRIRHTATPAVNAHPIPPFRSSSQTSFSSNASNPDLSSGFKRIANQSTNHALSKSQPNLDYLSFNNDDEPALSYSSVGSSDILEDDSPDQLTGHLNKQPPQVSFDALFPSSDMLRPYISSSPSTAQFDWGSDAWTMPEDLHNQAVPQSVLSFSEEEITSGEEWSVGEIGADYRQILMPNVDGFGFESFDGAFQV